ncbi:MAG: N-acetylmuramoyl-L-alanine amidase [Christensenellaceae bacterium]|nr:N-acetylmuramoyl-L-alanine amidase [Christensenellaceae bacterium]
MRMKKERAITLLAALTVLIGGLLIVALLLQGATGQNKTAEAPSEEPQPTATPEPLPLTGWTILIDPGHGGYDGGARARDSGVWEKVINLNVALQVEKSLMSQGAAVIMTRREDADLCTADRPAALTKKRQDMLARVEMAVSAKVDMVLSIHMNEYRARGESGPQVFYRQGSDAGRLLAGCMQEALIEQLQPRKQRAAMAGDYFILQLDVPSVLVECGFISNPEEERLLLSEDYQARLGGAVAAGVMSYVELQEVMNK